jgi:hypothetical protein
MLTVIDEYTRECLAIEVARHLQSLGERLQRVVQRQATRRAARTRNLHTLKGGLGADRALAPALQSGVLAEI